MTGTQTARIWMLLHSERSLGLESVRWRLRKAAAPVRSDARPAAAARSALQSAPVAPARPAYRAPARQADLPATPAPTLLATPVNPAAMLKGMRPVLSDAPLVAPEKRPAALDELQANFVKGCKKCRLCEGRSQTVFGEGSATAQLMFIGEGPGETEDQTGRPFVGRAGNLLNKMIEAMGLTREQVYIANVVKCRPPDNRTPVADEVAACTPYLVRQIEIIRPRVIVTLGLPATQFMLGTDRPMAELRGIWHDWQGTKIMPTYHPAYVLRSYTPTVRGKVWSDLQKVMQELGLPMKSGGAA